MNRKTLLARLKHHAPLLISVCIAVVFALMAIIIETGYFQYGPLSKDGLIYLLDLKSLDVKFKNRTIDDLPPPQVVIAAIDEKGCERDRYGLWPWSRRVIGDFITKTAGAGAAVIGFDAVFSDEDRNSSYQSVKKFVDAFDEGQLGASSERSRKLTDDVAAAETSLAEVQKATKALEDKVNAQRGPGHEALAAALAAAKRAEAKSSQGVTTARAALADWQKRSQAFYDLMSREVAAISPDEAFAKAVAAANDKVVLGYINFNDKSEIIGVSQEQAIANLKLLEPVAIRQLYNFEVQEIGGTVAQMAVPVEDVDIDDMQIHPIIGTRAPLPRLAQAAKYFGYFNVTPDPDGPFRRIRMFNRYGNTMYPALSLMMAARYFGSDIRPLNGSITPGRTLDGIYPLNPEDQAFVPTNMQGHFLVNYYTNPENYFKKYSVADFIDGTVPPEDVEGKVVLFGMTAHGLYDVRATPFGSVPGVYIHAMAIQNMIDGRFLERPFGLALVEALAYILLGILMGLVLPRVSALVGLLITVAFVVGMYFVDMTFVFSRGTWMLNVLPTIQCIMTFLGVSVYGYLTEGREKRMIRGAFQLYLTKSVVDEVLKDPTKLKLGGARVNGTVMFSDIRGFTTLSERLSPESLVSLLNSYLTPMTDIVHKYDGTLDKYIGDAIMAIFGAPIQYTDHSTRACKVALEMMENLHQLQPIWREQKLPELDIGIGLNSGDMAAGNMGSSQRFSYTVMGDNVNLASRLEGINKQYGTNIIISEFTYEQAKNDICVREMDMVRVKGKHEPVKIYELLGLGQPDNTRADLIAEFQKAILLYRAQKWQEAIAQFELVRTKIKPNDFASGMYIERSAAMAKTPPAPDWDGVYVMKTK